MTGTIDDAFSVSEDGAPARGAALGHMTQTTALLEQAKGVLIFRYAVDAATALSLLELWSAENGHSVEAVAHAVVHEICQGDRTGNSDPQLVRWLEDRLRHEIPGPHHAVSGAPTPVTVAVDHSDSSLDAVVEAARQADRAGLPLVITLEHLALPDDSDLTRAQLMQRIDLAVELARGIAPGLEVRVPTDVPVPPVLTAE